PLDSPRQVHGLEVGEQPVPGMVIPARQERRFLPGLFPLRVLRDAGRGFRLRAGDRLHFLLTASPSRETDEVPVAKGGSLEGRDQASWAAEQKAAAERARLGTRT